MPIIFEHLERFIPRVNKELGELYASIALRGFAVYLIGIFEPIYLYLNFGNSLSKTFLFLGAISFIFGLVAPFGAKILSKIGVKHAMLWSAPFLFFYYVGLWQIDKLGFFIFVLVLLRVMHNLFYWPAYHIDFTRFSDQGKRGREVGYRTIILSIVAAIAPLLGGIMITFYGFPMLFMIVLALLFASTIPLFLSKEVKEEYHDRYLETFKMMFKKQYIKKTVAFASRGIEFSILAYIWPLYLFVLAISFKQLGWITSGSLLIGIVFTYFLAKAADKMGTNKLLSMGAVLNAIFWPIKFFVSTPLDAFLAHSLHRFGIGAAYIPFAALFYDWAGKYKTSRDRFVVFREIVTNLFRGAFLFILAFVFMFTSNLAALFLIAPIFALGFLFMVDKPKKLLNDES